MLLITIGIMAFVFQNCVNSKDVVTAAMHDILVDRLRSLSRYYSHSAKTFFLSVTVMDRFLSVVKVMCTPLVLVVIHIGK